MDTFLLEMSDHPKFRFEGEILARVANSGNPEEENKFSGHEGIWTELVFYKTRAGRFVCHRIVHFERKETPTKYDGDACPSAESVMRFFGHG